MNRVARAFAVVLLGLATGAPVYAQYPINRAVIANSGNGFNNNIGSINQNLGFQPILFQGSGFPGMNLNTIANSGNGMGNTVMARNWNQGPGGMNINTIVNSGNGMGNRVIAGNCGPGYQSFTVPVVGTININTIVGSGNGSGNWIKAVNR